jgi:HK97 family phage portal protein
VIVSGGKTLGFAPQALGETVPTLANGYFYASTGLGLLNQFAAYSALYRKQPMIATVVDKVAASAARLTVKVWDTTPETGRVQDKTSPYARLMADPCTEMSPFNFWRWTFSTYEIFGEAFWYKVRRDVDADGKPSGPVLKLLPMHPSRVAVHRDIEGDVEYIFTLGVASTGILYAPARDVVAFLRYNPESLMRGLSRLEPLNATLLNEDAARRANKSFWEKGARPGTVLTHPDTLSQPAMDRIKANFDARHGGADNAGGTAVLEEGMTAAVIQLNAEEMQYIEGRKMNLQEACMVYDVPPPVIHILDHATYSNITEQMRSMYRDTMSPRLEDVESAIDFGLLGDFGMSGIREVEFDMSEVLRGDFEGRTTAVVALRNAGLATGNQGLEIMGFPRSEDPEMDKFYANAALVPLGTPAQRVSITENATPDPAMVAEAQDTAAGAQVAASDATKAVTVRAVMGKLARVKGTKPAIRAALVVEHRKALAGFFDKQRASVKSSASSKAAGVFDPAAWDGDLASILHTLSKATAQAIGTKVAADLGGVYSSDEIASWLESNSADTAKRVNQTTADEIAKAIEGAAEDESLDDTIDGVFDGEIAARTDQISMSRVALVGGLASLVAARLSKARTKTWDTGMNPRSSHAYMSGETVALGEPFSNGMNGPGDYSGGADEVANCNCDLSFGTD